MQRLRRGPATWPGRLTLLLVLIVVTGSGVWAAQHGERVVAESRANRLAQAAPLATQPPTITPSQADAPAATQISATTMRTRAPVSTTVESATARVLSPLATPTLHSPTINTITDSVEFTPVVPLPAAALIPHVAPVGIAATTLVTGTQTSATVTPTAAPRTTPDAATLVVLLPTPTPSPTLTIAEALAQPVAGPGGLAGIVAAVTATALAPSSEIPALAVVAASDALPEAPVEAPAEAEVVIADAPTPQPTLLPQAAFDGTVRTVRVPILMYHYLSVPPADADIYRRDLSVTPDLFAAHLDAMQQAGYTPISLYALTAHLTQGAPLPEKPVVLTFDDGYRDTYEHAFPRLRDRGMTATFFIVTDFIDDQRPEYLTWDMVREMYAAGMSIESHGRNHVSLKNKDRDYLIWQALGSLETIQFELGVRPRFVSYPAGDYDQATIDIFRSADYWAGFTTIQGATHRSDDLFQLRRVRVRGGMTAEELLRLLALDW